MNNTLYNSITELRNLIQTREASSQEVTENYLARVELYNSNVNCFLFVDQDGARKQAEELDKELQQGHIRSPLHGIPIALKDIFEKEGHRVTAGSKSFSHLSHKTATVVSRLVKAGVVILGYLNLDEFAAGGTGENAHFGRCKNPWHHEHIAGGSSSGSASAVASRLAIATLGSDAGGSIRVPSAYCGVTGMKPTYGRVSRFGAIPRTWSMDCIGPIAHNAKDCAVVLDVIAGADDRDITSLDSPTLFLEALSKPLHSMRIGVDKHLISQSDDVIQRACDETIHVIGELGNNVHDIHIPNIDLLNHLQQVIVKAEGAALHGKRARRQPEDLSIEMKSAIQEGFGLPATTYIEALSLRTTLLNEFNTNIFSVCDAVLLPVTPNTVPKHSAASVNDLKTIDKAFSESARYTRFVNYLGLPAITFPCGFDKGYLPLGLQLIGTPWSEATLLQMVHAIQNLTDHHLCIPSNYG